MEYRALVNGPGNEQWFEWVGHWVQDHLRLHHMVEPGVAFLDVGCGCGRVARFLMDDPIGRYEGFDRHQGMIAWCNDVLAPRDARFHFTYVSVRSIYAEWDQQGGDITADAFVFPYGDGSFDSILLASIFTHMPLPEIAQYLREARRVLRPGGQILLSIFYADGPAHLKDAVNYFHEPERFFALLSETGLLATPLEPKQLYGYNHNWYIVTHA
jgi:ubiquinone/menaquinone biosynthesis C-methylase UbiE